jgi:hypothetical protein
MLFEDWLYEFDIPSAGGQPDMPQGPAGANPLGMGPGGMPPQEPPPGPDPNAPPQQDPNITKQGVPEKPDVTQDPQTPDMPDEGEDLDFEEWKNKFFKESVKADPYELENLIKSVRDRDLEPYERKFVEDNLQIVYLRQQANIRDASKKIRQLVKQELDQNNPASSIVNHMDEVLKTAPELLNVFIKMNGLLGAKGDAHRKYIAALLGAVQVGSGANTEDIVYNEGPSKDTKTGYSIGISTRIASQFGDVVLGKWSLKEDDPEKYLEEAELKRLEEGSPEEKDVLRRRIVMESIADKYNTRAFIITVADEDGTVHNLGWDLANSLRAAYKEGKLVVKAIKSENSEAMIDDQGAIIAQLDLKIEYKKATGELDADGNREMKEVPFMERRDGLLFLIADLQLLQQAASTLQGVALKQYPYAGNPSDIKALMRSVPNATELLLRNP